jgi:tetratricopeptide (TPR) repeat protein/predicted aspartyl protease
VGFAGRSGCVGVMAVLGLAAVPAWSACTMSKIAELPITMQGMEPMTDAKVNGTDVRFLVDSGAFYSGITPGSARALGLRIDPMPGWRVQGINGSADMSVTTVKKFTLVGADLPNLQFVVAGSELGSTGVLGQNFLGLFDAEYDLPHGAIRLMKATGCERVNLAYWANGKPYSFLPIEPLDGRNRHTIGTVLLNGVKIRATFDTGASTSLLTMAAAARAGLTPKTPGVVPGGMTWGFGRKLVPTWIATVDSFKVGDQEEIKHGRIRFGEMEGDTDMLLGADFFISHRVYVSNRLHRMFITYEGGPVFNLKTQHVDDTGAKIVEQTAPANAAPATAEELSRSGAVKLTQNDRDGAIADFDKAVAMAPTEPRYLLQRADANLGAGRRLLAAADIDKALALKADDVEALMLRARLQLRDGGEGRPEVLADLDAADHAAAPAAMERLALGQLYEAAGHPDRSIPQFDQWIRFHPDDVRRPEALNGRCWARALAGKDLPAALSDCNAALRQRSGNLSILDSKALVELRMGDFAKAIADYNTVLAKEPKQGWSLYGRGIAKLRSGDAEGGKTDIAAASVVAPKLADRAKGYGIAP